MIHNTTGKIFSEEFLNKLRTIFKNKITLGYVHESIKPKDAEKAILERLKKPYTVELESNVIIGVDQHLNVYIK